MNRLLGRWERDGGIWKSMGYNGYGNYLFIVVILINICFIILYYMIYVLIICNII